MKTNFYLVIAILLLASCQNIVQVNPSDKPIEETLNLLLKEAIDNSYESIPGVAMSIVSSELPNGRWSGVSGYDSKEKEDLVRVEQPFRIASVTKSFVATAILRLHEKDSISITDPISKYISSEHSSILRGDGYDPDKILVRHCLNHTAGLFDYAMNHENYMQACMQEPNKRWTRTEQLEGAMKWGDKQGEPGEKYLYCDTGYILLGEVIEVFYKGDLAAGLRDLLKFNELGLNSTWLESLEPSPLSSYDPVHRYLGRLDATTWDASIDLYGGGGLMSTCPDLGEFIHALFNNRIFDNPETLELMKTEPLYDPLYDPDDDERFKDYRYGLWEISIYGEKAYIHSGFWGCTMLHIPKRNMSIATNITDRWNARMIKKAVLAINNLNSRN